MTQESTTTLETVLSWMTGKASATEPASNVGPEVDPTFLSVQEFDDEGRIALFKGLTRSVKSIEKTDDGTPQKATLESKFDLDYATQEAVKPFATLEEAEAYVLGEELFWAVSRPPMKDVKPKERFAKDLRRACANVYTHTKRGRGNTVIFHPNNRHTVEEAIKEEGELKMFANERAPLDKVLVLYQGQSEAEQPLIYVEGEGLILNSAFSDIINYGKFVKL